MRTHYGDKDGLLALSYGGILTAVLSNRNYGKTWTFKRRAFRRAMKHGKKTIWLRMFKKEVKEAVALFYSSKDLRDYCGISVYDKEANPNGNFRQNGNTFYYRTSPKSRWRWFLKVYALSDADAVRSADDVDTDTIVFDEFTKTPDKYKKYRGNMVNDFVDILFSSKREHAIRCILLGNKESVSNPFFTYFGIKPLPSSFEGIRSYRKGSFIVQQINNMPTEATDYDTKMNALLNGTSYGNYIYKSDFKNNSRFKAKKTPADASIYTQLWINGKGLKVSTFNGNFYINDRIDINKPIYCDTLPHRFKLEFLYIKRYRKFFIGLVNALADNRVYYDSPATYEQAQAFFQWLCI